MCAYPSAKAGAPLSRGRRMRLSTGFADSLRHTLSITESQAVLAGLGAADQYTALVIDPDRLAASERHLLDRDLMTAIGEILGDRRRYRTLDLQLTLQRQDPRLLGSLLGVHAPIQHAVQEMSVPDRLILPAHDAERHYRAAVLDEHPGDDRVERPLARRNGVGMAGDRAKAGPAIVQQHAAVRRQDAGPEAREERVDERAGVPVAVDDAEIDRVFVLDLGPAWPGNCVVEPDFPAGALGASLGEEPADIDRHMLGIADEVVANRIRGL